LWKHVRVMGEDIEDLMAGELTEESLEGILEKGKTRSGGKRSWAQADLEDGQEIVSAETIEEYYVTYKRLRPLQMTMVWNSVWAYTKHAYRVNAGLQEAIPVELGLPEDKQHVEHADTWFRDEVPVRAWAMRHKILVIEGATGTGKTTYVETLCLSVRRLFLM
jgi:Cdc6-like AAA superfamily ATPase